MAFAAGDVANRTTKLQRKLCKLRADVHAISPPDRPTNARKKNIERRRRGDKNGLNRHKLICAMCFPILYQICVDFWKPIFKAMRLPTGGQEVCTSLALKDTSPRCRTCCLGNSSMFKSPMATFSKELEAIRNVPVHPLSAAA